MSENIVRRDRGELFHAFTSELIIERQRCADACNRLNTAVNPTRRECVCLWRDVVNDKTPLPAIIDDPEADAAQFDNDPWVEAPVHIDYGNNVILGPRAYLNFNATFLATCKVRIGSRTLVGPNVAFYGAKHPLDPLIRDGTKGPEMGNEIDIGEDCWIGGNVVILPGVTVGNGATIGAGSVVTKNVPAFHVVAGNPARILRKIKTALDLEQSISAEEQAGTAAEVATAWKGAYQEKREVSVTPLPEQDVAKPDSKTLGIKNEETTTERVTPETSEIKSAEPKRADSERSLPHEIEFERGVPEKTDPENTELNQAELEKIESEKVDHGEIKLMEETGGKKEETAECASAPEVPSGETTEVEDSGSETASPVVATVVTILSTFKDDKVEHKVEIEPLTDNII